MPNICSNVTDLIGKPPLLRLSRIAADLNAEVLATGERYLSTILFQNQ